MRHKKIDRCATCRCPSKAYNKFVMRHEHFYCFEQRPWRCTFKYLPFFRYCGNYLMIKTATTVITTLLLLLPRYFIIVTVVFYRSSAVFYRGYRDVNAYTIT